MSASVRVLRVDWELLRASYPSVSDEELAREALARAGRILATAPEERVPDDVTGPERLERLGRLLARKAASVAVHRFELISQRERVERADRLERETYEQHLELDKDVVPPLKLEAKELRVELRRLEREAGALGIDVDEIEPAIDWDQTIFVDVYEPPRYETNEQRSRNAVEFFKRTSGS